MSVPVSRDFLRGLKIKRDEEKRIEKVKNCVRRIYEQAILAAETSTGTMYSLDIDPQQTRRRMNNINDYNIEYQFYKDNIEEILSDLQTLFPDCAVKLAKMCSGKDRKRYDISTMDEKMLSLIFQHEIFECIVIDWS